MAEGSSGLCDFNGGPGLGRNQRAAGNVKMSHHAPIKKSTTRKDRVVLFIK